MTTAQMRLHLFAHYDRLMPLLQVKDYPMAALEQAKADAKDLLARGETVELRKVTTTVTVEVLPL